MGTMDWERTFSAINGLQAVSPVQPCVCAPPATRKQFCVKWQVHDIIQLGGAANKPDSIRKYTLLLLTAEHCTVLADSG